MHIYIKLTENSSSVVKKNGILSAFFFSLENKKVFFHWVSQKAW